MGLINNFKALYTFLKQATSINLSNIEIHFWECQDANPGSWVRSKNATSVLCSPPNIKEEFFNEMIQILL